MAAASAALTFAPDVPARLAQLPRTPVDYDRKLLNEKEARVVQKLVEASRFLDELFGGRSGRETRTCAPAWPRPCGRASPEPLRPWPSSRFNKGPWDRLKGGEPFIGTQKKPAGAGFYPEDMTKAEFEAWIAKHPEDKEAFQGLFTVIRRQGDRPRRRALLEGVSRVAEPAAGRLREAAAHDG